MLGLTSLGIIHTAISLVAVAAGICAFARDGRITLDNGLGRLYVITTVLTCLTGFGIFQHGGFGKPHVLGIVTLLVLLIAWGAGTRGWFGHAGRYIETVAYSLTFFFHMIPGFTETLTRLPEGAPWAANDADPKLQALVGAAFLLFLIGSTWQVLRLRRARGTGHGMKASRRAGPHLRAAASGARMQRGWWMKVPVNAVHPSGL